MCGIVGYVGQRDALDIVVEALRRMEYRGYDSAGVAIVDGHGHTTIEKKAGRLENLDSRSRPSADALTGTTGMGHTRWATHGQPTDRNAHPHVSTDKKIAVVHNGIIENYAPLRDELENSGIEFSSDTDTETAVHLIEREYASGSPPETSSPARTPPCAASKARSPWSSPTPTIPARSSPHAGPRRSWWASVTVRCSSVPTSPHSSSTPAMRSNSVTTRWW